VLVLGGTDDGPEAALYAAYDGDLSGLAGAPDRRRRDAAAVRLDDGTVLVVGGAGTDGAPLDDAWIFRPPLTGPLSASASIAFADPELARQVVPSDPARARVMQVSGGPPRYRLEATRAAARLPSVWGVVAGPELSAPRISVRARADRGGVAVLVGYRDPRATWAVVLEPGTDAALVRADGGAADVVAGCDARPVAGDALSGDGLHELAIDVTGDGLRASVDGALALSCPQVDTVPRGLVGVGPVGAADAALELAFVAANR
jgi:hypothetical protein